MSVSTGAAVAGRSNAAVAIVSGCAPAAIAGGPPAASGSETFLVITVGGKETGGGAAPACRLAGHVGGRRRGQIRLDSTLRLRRTGGHPQRQGPIHRFQPPQEDRGGGDSLFRVLAEELHDDLLQLGGGLRGQIGQRRRFLEPLLQEEFRQRLTAKQRPTRQEHVKHPPEAVEVRTRPDRPALGLLRRHELRRAQDAARRRVRRAAEETGDPKIGKFHLPGGRQQEIPRLDVAMDHAAIVGVSQGPGDIHADPRHLPPGEGPPAVQLLLQAAAGDEFHGVEQVLALVAEAKQPDDVRMVELSQSFDFRLEAMAEIGVVGHRRGKQLHGGWFAGLGVDPLIDRAHAAAAEFSPNLIGAKLLDKHFIPLRRRRLPMYLNRRLQWTPVPKKWTWGRTSRATPTCTGC